MFNSQLFVDELQKHNIHLNNNCLKGNVSRLHVLLTLMVMWLIVLLLARVLTVIGFTSLHLYLVLLPFVNELIVVA